LHCAQTASVAKHTVNAKMLSGLCRYGPSIGYNPQPVKSIYVCSAQEEPAARAAFQSRGHTLEYSRGERYLGGFVGSHSALEAWIRPRVEQWCEAVTIMEDIAKRYPQTAYYGLAISLQNEWQHVCRTVPTAGAFLDPLEKALSSFLSTMLDAPLDEELRTLLGHKVKQAGMGISKP